MFGENRVKECVDNFGVCSVEYIILFGYIIHRAHTLFLSQNITDNQ